MKRLTEETCVDQASAMLVELLRAAAPFQVDPFRERRVLVRLTHSPGQSAKSMLEWSAIIAALLVGAAAAAAAAALCQHHGRLSQAADVAGAMQSKLAVSETSHYLTVLGSIRSPPAREAANIFLRS